MPNALIYSPDFDGHRQVYVFVLAHNLRELGFNVAIAGDMKTRLLNSFYIDNLKKDGNIQFVDTSEYPEKGVEISPSEFIALQNSCNSDLTIFAEADNHISLFTSQMSGKQKRFRGKSAGIFLRPFYYYEKQGFLDKLRYLKHLPERWKTDEFLFHEYFLRRFSLLDAALYLDENFTAHHKKTIWLPDVFQEYTDQIIHDEKTGQREWIGKLNDFKKRNDGRFLFLYFGTDQYRRGYDALLKLALDKEGCFIHCGLNTGKEKSVHNVDQIRSELSDNGRLFETNQYIEDPSCVEYFFKSVSHLILPYRNFYGSSGIMLQALSYGIPVLAPENGVIGYRIRKYGLGSTYSEKNGSSLDKEFDNFRKTDPEMYEENIKNYMKLQSADQLKKTLSKVFSSNN